MVVTTSLEEKVSFSVSLDDQVVYKISELPEKFVLQLPGPVSYWFAREPVDFLSRRRFVLSDLEGKELASISGSYLGKTTVSIGDTGYRVKYRFPNILDLFKGQRISEVKGLPLMCDSRENVLSIHLNSHVDDSNDFMIAVAVLFHFAQIYRWRRSG